MKYNITWIRTLMPYHKFENLNEIFNAELSTKLMVGIESPDFPTKNLTATKNQTSTTNISTMENTENQQQYTKENIKSII